MRHLTFPLLPFLTHTHIMPGKNAMVPPAHRAFGCLKMISHFELAAVSAYRVGDSFRNISKCQAGWDAAFLRRKPQQGQYYGFPQSIHHWWCGKASVEPMACSSCDIHGLISAVVSCRRESSGYLLKVHAYRVGNCMSCQRHDPVKLVGFSTSALKCNRLRQKSHRLVQKHSKPTFMTRGITLRLQRHNSRRSGNVANKSLPTER